MRASNLNSLSSQSKSMNVRFLTTLVAVSPLLTIIGAYLKIVHSEHAEGFLIVGLLASLVLMAVFVREAIVSRYMDRGERFMWIVAFVFLGWLAALLFLLKYRRVLRNT